MTPPAAPPDIFADPDVIALRLANVGDQVRAHITNPPPAVEPPVELALKRPDPDTDDLEFPPFLRRAAE